MRTSAESLHSPSPSPRPAPARPPTRQGGQVLRRHVGEVPAGHTERAVAELCLDLRQRRALTDELNSMGVTQPVKVDTLPDACSPRDALQHCAAVARADSSPGGH